MGDTDGDTKVARRTRKPKASDNGIAEKKNGDNDDTIPAGDVTASATSMILYLVDYYAELALWSHLRATCDTHLTTSPGDNVVHFWRAYAATMEGNGGEAIPKLTELAELPELALPATAALVVAHNSVKGKDKKAILALKAKLKVLTKQKNAAALAVAGRYFLHTGKVSKAKQCVEKLLTKDRANVGLLSLFGWIYVKTGDPKYQQKSLKLFRKATKLTATQPDISSLLGRVRYEEWVEKKLDGAIGHLDKSLTCYPDLLSFMEEKSRLLCFAGKWTDAQSVAKQILTTTPDSIPARRVLVIGSLLYERRGTPSQITYANDLVASLDKTEAKNHSLYHTTAVLMASLAQRDDAMLEVCGTTVKRAVKLNTRSADYVCASADFRLRADKAAAAASVYAKVLKADAEHLPTKLGMLMAHIKQKQNDEAQTLLKTLTVDHGGEPEVLYAQARLTTDKAETAIYLGQAFEAHLLPLRDKPRDYSYLISYRPDLIIEMAQLYFRIIGKLPPVGDAYPKLLETVTAALEDMVTLIPVMLAAHLLLGQCYLVQSGRRADSLKHLQRCLELDPEHATVQKLLSTHHGITSTTTSTTTSSNGSGETKSSLDRPRSSSPDPASSATPRRSSAASVAAAAALISPPPAPRSNAGVQSPADTIPAESFSLESVHDELGNGNNASTRTMPWQQGSTPTGTGPGPGRKVGGLMVAIPDNQAKLEAELAAKSGSSSSTTILAAPATTTAAAAAAVEQRIDPKKRAAEQAAEEEKEQLIFEQKEEARREAEAKRLRDRMAAQLRSNNERREKDEKDRVAVEEQAKRDRDAAEVRRHQHDAEMSFAREEADRNKQLEQARTREEERRKLQMEAAERAAADLRRAEMERQKASAAAATTPVSASSNPSHRFAVAAASALPAAARATSSSLDNGRARDAGFDSDDDDRDSDDDRPNGGNGGVVNNDMDIDDVDSEDEGHPVSRLSAASRSAAGGVAPAPRTSGAPSRLGVSRIGRAALVDDGNLQAMIAAEEERDRKRDEHSVKSKQPPPKIHDSSMRPGTAVTTATGSEVISEDPVIPFGSAAALAAAASGFTSRVDARLATPPSPNGIQTISLMPVSPGGPSVPLTPTPITMMAGGGIGATTPISVAAAGHTPHGGLVSPSSSRHSNHWAGRSEESKKALERKERKMEESRRINAAKDFARSAFHGEVFVKHGRHGKPHGRNVTVEVGDKSIKIDWNSGHMVLKPGDKTVVTPGKKTAVLQRATASSIDEGLCFSVLHSSRTLDLQARTKDLRDYWVAGLSVLVNSLHATAA